MGANAEAIILKGMNYGENDRILRLLSLDHGKISAIAKGVRKEKSTLKGAIEPITLGIYHLNAGRNMFLISQAEIINIFRNIKNSLQSIVAASFMMDLSDSFLEENNPDIETYALLKNALLCLEMKTEKWNEISLHFEINIHKIHGVLPDIYRCIACGSMDAGKRVKVDVNRGGVLCKKCSQEFPRDESYPLESLYVIEKASRLAIDNFVNEKSGKMHLTLARNIIAQFTRHYLGKEIKSRNALNMNLIQS